MYVTPYLVEFILTFLLPKAWTNGLDQAQCRESGLLHALVDLVHSLTLHNITT